MKDAQENAKLNGKGLWGPDPSSHVRNITWEVETPRVLVDKMGGKPVKAVIEHVRDGSTVRAFLLPDFYHVTVMMSGIRVSWVLINVACGLQNISELAITMRHLFTLN